MIHERAPRWSSLFGPSLFDLLARPGAATASSIPWPALNVWTEDQTAFVEAELPGLAEGDLDVSVTGDVLTLSGTRPEVVEEGLSVQRRERRVGAFRRVVRLPFEVDADAVGARLVDGVLTITLPAAAAARPRVIPVQTGER